MQTVLNHETATIAATVPPLEHGDRLSREEFLRRWEAMPRLKKAELIGGRVFIEATIKPRASIRTVDRSIPPLENGDRLPRDEFRRRWANMPGLKRAERFGGSVFMQAAVRFREHGQPHQDLQGWMMHYKAFTPGIEGGVDATVEDPLDDAQPDGCLLIAPERGGQCRVNDEGYLVGAPEFVAEVAASSASFDLHDKFDAYQRSGVREYLVWKVLERSVVWFELVEGEFVDLPPDEDGIHRSRVLPGLWLDSPSLLASRLDRVLDVLDEGLASSEHAEFVKRLAEARGSA
ncbi:MAG: Uma2 family endonuclease [Planctomycetales bacterium]